MKRLLIIVVVALLSGCATEHPLCRALRCYTAQDKTTIKIEVDKEQIDRTPYFKKDGHE